MSRNSPSVGSALAGLLGVLSFSVLAGILVAVMVTPAITVARAAVSTTAEVFDRVPGEITIDRQPQQNRIFATENGSPVQIATIFDQNREEVTWDQVSEFAKDAAVSGEDRRFYEHGGIDPAGIVRAAVTNVAAGSIAEGASTITQQYVKNTFIQAALELPEAEQAAAYNAAIDTSFARKVQEMKLAITLEKEYTKEEILLAYLNIASFGGTTYGIEAAAQRYYNTSSLNLSAAQAASLIAIVQSPTALRLDNPDNWQRNTERRNVILNAMLADGNLTPEQHAEAVAVVADGSTVALTNSSNGCLVAHDFAQYFCDYITNLIPELTALGSNPDERVAAWRHGGFDIHTTLDLNLQVTAQNAVWANAPNDTTRLELGAAAVSVEAGTGRILTMAQNKIFDNTGDADATTTAVNFTTDRAYGGSSGFQPGSTYKVFTLLNWLENGRGINEIVNGSPRTIPQNQFSNRCDPSQLIGRPYEFGNDDGFGGNMTVATGVQRSVNGAFMSMALELDLCEIKETAESIGVHRADGGELGSTPASVLGTNEIAPLTMATAYAAIANEGVFCEAIAVDRVTGPDGTELGGQPQECSRQLSEDVANTAAYAMAGVMVGGGTATRSNPNDGVEYIGKTGTTDSSNQTWVVGASTRVATAVWVGNIEGAYPMRSYRNIQGVQGGVIRHDIFRPIASAVDDIPAYRGTDFPEPAPDLVGRSAPTRRSSAD
ncbi:membrane peptidoglycan carboxypeptidase [Glaciihabitans tibetensis]|uniref:Membrane peptidoglycan carboxypeptidase n=1 Tax=Glaciihabitans tibetensis TaxID=1266600 RepID=A0A2T0VG21_9MICO|nr:transglycosylase domain-containing protein [Glaciihabitans tibetensis]PRY69159.1 membrane peptidoglycan carboxypeptidase [Glaciihabitans tibetensis]